MANKCDVNKKKDEVTLKVSIKDAQFIHTLLANTTRRNDADFAKTNGLTQYNSYPAYDVLDVALLDAGLVPEDMDLRVVNDCP
jgi:hypothetical protein